MNVPPLVAETLFHIGPLPVTNALLNGWIAVILLVVFAILLQRRRAAVPRGLQNATEAATEFFLGTVESVTHDRERARKFLPIVGTIFIFILLSNWMGLIPGTGSIGLMRGEEFIPLFRPAGSDLNFTIALAVTSVLIANIFGIATIGFFKHLNHFIPFGTVVASFKKGGIGIFTGIVEFFVGLIELVSEVAKIVSLSLRLFGNVFAGEVLLTVIASLMAFFVPLPFMGLELLVGVIQAMVFSLLVLVYLTVATEPVHAESH